jgi:hypothetical protein
MRKDMIMSTNRIVATVFAPARLIGLLALSGCISLLLASGALAQPQSPFGISAFSVTTSTDQAGAHPDVTTSFTLASDSEGEPNGKTKEVIVDLPTGFSGQETGLPVCPGNLFEKGTSTPCPADTQIGVASTTLFFKSATQTVGDFTEVVPLYNLTSGGHAPAQFGYRFLANGQSEVRVVVTVRPGDFGLRATVKDINDAFALAASTVTLWGVPGESSHNAQRGQVCVGISAEPLNCFGGGEGGLSGIASVPFITNPTGCTGSPLSATLTVASWEDPEQHVSTTAPVGPFSGCDELQFSPSLSVLPTVSTSDTPAGLRVDLQVPQDQNPENLATANVRTTTVTLPAGVTLSPSAAGGLGDCTPAQFGFGNANPPACPDNSQVATVTSTTPDLNEQLYGFVYLAGPESGPITGPPYSMFLTLAGDGVRIKVKGTVTPDPLTGQLTAVFPDDPPLPFSDLSIDFNQGPRAPLSTPSSCGMFTTTSDLEPWSAPFSGQDPTPNSTFTISGCPNPDTFAPTFAAGSTGSQAGQFAPFALSFSRSDADQQFSGLTAKLPPGLLAKLAGVPLCPDADANAGTCPAGSRVGTVEVESGPGLTPFWLPGSVYLTGPYKGGPYGIAVEVQAVAGPFNLGVVTVRGSINLDPTSAQVTVRTDPFPTIVAGVPVQVRTIDTYIDRSDFTLNPTSCNPMSVQGTLTSLGGLSAQESSPFEVAGCSTLQFKPQFSASTGGKPSRADGTGLDVKLSYPNAPFGTQANIAKVKVELPKQLPARLSTLQKACPDATFESNPAACPAASMIGEATATTPLVPVSLNGPAYFVSHGGAKFPELIIVLSGYGITVDLHGETFINKEGVTSSTFSTVPDVPIGSFELKLPAGPDSALTGNGNLCASKLIMPTSFIAQNGVTLQQNTNIKVTGCKPTLTIIHHKTKGKTATIVAKVPSAGTLVANGPGVSNMARTTSSAGDVTIELMLSTREQALVERHPGRKYAALVELHFTPQHGQPMFSAVMVLLG